MAQNLAEKYSGKVQTIETRTSVIAGRTNTDYEFDGTRTINVWTPTSQELKNYERTGANRYGEPEEMSDTKQRLELTKEKSYAITVDKGNNTDQMNFKKAGLIVKVQTEEQMVPFWDKDALKVWAEGAGKKVSIATLDKDNIVDQFIAARTHFVNQNITIKPETCTAYITASAFAYLEKNPDFLGVEGLATQLLTTGTVGKCKNFLIKEIPDSYLPAKTPILFTNKKACLSVKKLNELKIHDNPPGINGLLIEARDYGDSFVLDTHKQGIVAINVTTGA